MLQLACTCSPAFGAFLGQHQVQQRVALFGAVTYGGDVDPEPFSILKQCSHRIRPAVPHRLHQLQLQILRSIGHMMVGIAVAAAAVALRRPSLPFGSGPAQALAL